MHVRSIKTQQRAEAETLKMRQHLISSDRLITEEAVLMMHQAKRAKRQRLRVKRLKPRCRLNYFVMKTSSAWEINRCQ